MKKSQSDHETEAVESSTRHLLIAGTGRAGTSFLVRYLTELGLDTTLSRSRDGQLFWDDSANAGLEEIVTGNVENLPYVVKSPWIGEYLDQIIANPNISVDAILIPIRDLADAAVSRTVLEMRSMHQSAPWMAEMDQSWEVWATTPGGVVYSVNPLDQARLLAVSFHNLVWGAIQAGIPIHFLAFPRIIQEKEYLFDVLKPVLPAEVTADQAYRAHEKIADLAKVRVGTEDADRKRETAATIVSGGKSLRNDEVDTLAVRRELVRVRAELQRSAEAAALLEKEATELRSRALHVESELMESHSRAQHLQTKVVERENEIAAERLRAEQAEADIAALRTSRTWRATGPVRALLSSVKGNR